MTRATPVLIVDDEELIRNLMARILEASGFQTLTASSAREALAILETTPVGVVVTDIRMPPGEDGINLAWRTKSRWPTLPILICSARPWPEGEALPPNSLFLSKPVSADALIRLVRAAFQMSS